MLLEIAPHRIPTTFRTASKATIDNIRLWDWQPLMDAYVQLQEIRTYYKFHDVDVDRYWLDGAYQSVMHPRQRRGDEPGHPQERRRAAAVLSARYSSGCDWWSRHPQAAHLLRGRDRQLRHRQGEHAGVRLSEGERQYLRGL